MKPKPSSWILKEIGSSECNGVWCTSAKYLILHEQTAKKYWDFEDDKNLSPVSMANLEYFLTVGSDGEVTIKALFLKDCLSQFDIPSETEPSLMNSLHDWRHCSILLTNYCLHVYLAADAKKPEIFLMVKEFAILKTSHFDALDFVDGFMNYCMEFKAVRQKARAVFDCNQYSTFLLPKKERTRDHQITKKVANLSKKESWRNNASRSGHLEEPTLARGSWQITNFKSDVVSAPKGSPVTVTQLSGARRRKNTVLVEDLWKTCADDLPNWFPVACKPTSSLQNDQKCELNSKAASPQRYVMTRSSKVQTNSKRTGWKDCCNDRKEHLSASKCETSISLDRSVERFLHQSKPVINGSVKNSKSLCYTQSFCDAVTPLLKKDAFNPGNAANGVDSESVTNEHKKASNLASSQLEMGQNLRSTQFYVREGIELSFTLPNDLKSQCLSYIF